jgi:hypothetical protein
MSSFSLLKGVNESFSRALTYSSATTYVLCATPAIFFLTKVLIVVS